MKEKLVFATVILLVVTLVFAGCAGKAEIVTEPAKELSHEERAADLAVIKVDLEALSSKPRPIGLSAEKEAAQYIQERFREMGYSVTLQSYANKAGAVGTNVIAVQSAVTEDADILVISTHHDSVPSAYGANDNASGVAALLAVAESLKDIPTDTELRFISFNDEENGKNGSRAYTEALTETVRARIIGDIQLDMLGGLGSDGLVVSTMDGSANWLSDLLLQKMKTPCWGPRQPAIMPPSSFLRYLLCWSRRTGGAFCITQ